MNNLFENMYPNAEQEKEAIELAEARIEMWYEESEKIFNDDRAFWGKKLFWWWCVRNKHPTLKKEYEEKVIKKYYDHKIWENEFWMKRKISENIDLAKKDIRLDWNSEYVVMNYWSFKVIWDIINIWISYMVWIPWRWNVERFAYSLTIYKKHTPNIYEFYSKKILSK